MKAPREQLLYTIAIYVGTGIQKPDYLATIDADPTSPTYSQVISRCEMPGVGDELQFQVTVVDANGQPLSGYDSEDISWTTYESAAAGLNG